MSNSKHITINEVTIKVTLKKDTIELFTIPVPRWQQEFAFEDPTQVRVLDNPLTENFRDYVVWGRLK